MFIDRFLKQMIARINSEFPEGDNSFRFIRAFAAQSARELRNSRYSRENEQKLHQHSLWQLYRYNLHYLSRSSHFMTCERCEARFNCVCEMSTPSSTGLACFPLPYVLDGYLNDLLLLNRKLSLISHVHSLKGLTSEWRYAKLNGTRSYVPPTTNLVNSQNNERESKFITYCAFYLSKS